MGAQLEHNLYLNIAEVTWIYGKDKMYKIDPYMGGGLKENIQKTF
jgi:hypothetical protein